MLKSLDEIRAAQLTVRPVINGVDDPSVMSIDSTAPFETPADEVNTAEDGKEEEGSATPKTEKKVEEKTEEEETPAEPPQKKDETKIEKRIGELTKKWRTAQREADFLKTQSTKRISELEEELEKLKSKVPAENKPKRDDFDDYEAFLEALADWKVDARFKAAEGKEKKVKEEVNEKSVVDEVYLIMDQMIETGREKYEDFDAVAMDKDLMITDAMTELILESEVSADIMYYLGQNPDEAAEIAKLTPLKIAKKFVEIELKLKEGEGDEEEEEIPPPPVKPPIVKKKLTKTPEPITPVRETGAVDKDPSQMNAKEYRAWRERNKG
jgi:hypothetical protein